MSEAPKVIAEACDIGLRDGGLVELFDDWTIRITHDCGHLEARFSLNRNQLQHFFREGHEKLGDP